MSPEDQAVFDELFRASKEAGVTLATIRVVLERAGLTTDAEFTALRARMSAAMDQAIEEKRARLLAGD